MDSDFPAYLVSYNMKGFICLGFIEFGYGLSQQIICIAMGSYSESFMANCFFYALPVSGFRKHTGQSL